MWTVDVDPSPLAALAAQLDDVAERRFTAGAERARTLLAGRRVWNVSATATGGVGELLRTLLPYVRDAGIDARWLVVDGDEQFFRIATRLHHVLHAHPVDGGPLGAEEMAHYDRVLARNLDEVRENIAAGDVVLLHDPATVGLAPELRRRGALVVWRCHIGTDAPDGVTDLAWAFLEPSIAQADRVVLSRATYRPGFLDAAVVRVISPSVDPLSAKNRMLEPAEVEQLLLDAGLLAGDVPAGAPAAVAASGDDGGPPVSADVPTGATMRAGGPVPANARMLLQVSRWDRLKDMSGLLIAFDEGFEDLPEDVHLLLAGEEVAPHDSAAAEILADCLQMWEGLEPAVRARTHVACLPLVDRERNALLVNALQRRAAVIVQKSLAEGFGLTVAEALWKGRPVVATAVGGIQDQIADGTNGLLVKDPTDLHGLVAAVARLLAEPAFAEQLGLAAHDRVRRDFLSDRHLLQYVDLLDELL
ncbi:glycosyltransferase [Georgenia yuyongxinii]|uniref:Glycosyltransferase n=1 Tax=Georgenia yuyongxinii TaxID=2589797 RepID=A0A5B8C7T0_9MICO|nr:glycosyltransferase [Georgenia yuyongxinii]QDC26080.1 glycosyltransferase [Georgenia yuyongxinii]